MFAEETCLWSTNFRFISVRIFEANLKKEEKLGTMGVRVFISHITGVMHCFGRDNQCMSIQLIVK